MILEENKNNLNRLNSNRLPQQPTTIFLSFINQKENPYIKIKNKKTLNEFIFYYIDLFVVSSLSLSLFFFEIFHQLETVNQAIPIYIIDTYELLNEI